MRLAKPWSRCGRRLLAKNFWRCSGLRFEGDHGFSGPFSEAGHDLGASGVWMDLVGNEITLPHEGTSSDRGWGVAEDGWMPDVMAR